MNFEVFYSKEDRCWLCRVRSVGIIVHGASRAEAIKEAKICLKALREI